MPGIPSAPEIVAAILVVLLLLFMYGLYRDAKNQEMPYPVLWPFAFLVGLNLFFLPGVVVLTIYAYLRVENNQDGEGRETEPLTRKKDPFLEEEIDQNANRD